jgi:hypothetical protein
MQSSTLIGRLGPVAIGALLLGTLAATQPALPTDASVLRPSFAKGFVVIRHPGPGRTFVRTINGRRVLGYYHSSAPLASTRYLKVVRQYPAASYTGSLYPYNPQYAANPLQLNPVSGYVGAPYAYANPAYVYGSYPPYGFANGAPYGYGAGTPYGYSSTPYGYGGAPYGYGSGTPYGYGGAPYGYGSGTPYGYSSAPYGYGSGTPYGYGSGTPYGYGSGTPYGYGSGTPYGYGSGTPYGYGGTSCTSASYPYGSSYPYPAQSASQTLLAPALVTLMSVLSGQPLTTALLSGLSATSATGCGYPSYGYPNYQTTPYGYGMTQPTYVQGAAQPFFYAPGVTQPNYVQNSVQPYVVNNYSTYNVTRIRRVYRNIAAPHGITIVRNPTPANLRPIPARTRVVVTPPRAAVSSAILAVRPRSTHVTTFRTKVTSATANRYASRPAMPSQIVTAVKSPVQAVRKPATVAAARRPEPIVRRPEATVVSARESASAPEVRTPESMAWQRFNQIRGSAAGGPNDAVNSDRTTPDRTRSDDQVKPESQSPGVQRNSDAARSTMERPAYTPRSEYRPPAYDASAARSYSPPAPRYEAAAQRSYSERPVERRPAPAIERSASTAPHSGARSAGENGNGANRRGRNNQ